MCCCLFNGRRFWYGVETENVLHLKTLSFTKEEVSLTLSLSLSLFKKQREEQGQRRNRFLSRLSVVINYSARSVSESKERKEDWELEIYPRGNISVRAALEDEKRGGCREETNNAKTTDRC